MHMHKISVSSETGSSPFFFFSSFYYYCTHERLYETFEPVANCLPHEPSIRFVLCRKKHPAWEPTITTLGSKKVQLWVRQDMLMARLASRIDDVPIRTCPGRTVLCSSGRVKTNESFCRRVRVPDPSWDLLPTIGRDFPAKYLPTIGTVYAQLILQCCKARNA